MKTGYYGQETAKGTMFTLSVKEPLELLSMEFDAYDFSEDGVVLEDLSMQVYYRKGDFSGFTNNEDEWILLADTPVYLAPDSKGAIIPANEFTTVTMEPGEVYSIYLSFQTENVLKIQSSDRLIGESFQSNDILELFVGVTLEDGPFPDKFDQAADFSGVLHYRTLRQCSQVLMQTEVDLEFAINEDPEADIMQSLSDAVGNAITALTILTPNLIRYAKFHYLELQGVTPHFQGRSSKWKQTSCLSFFVCILFFRR
jgi:hypothetical protein